MGQPKSVALSCFLYRAVLRLGPSAFRMEFQHLLLSDFRHLCLEAHARAGAEGVFALLPCHMLHTFRDISGEHFNLVKCWSFKMLQGIYITIRAYAIVRAYDFMCVYHKVDEADARAQMKLLREFYLRIFVEGSKENDITILKQGDKIVMIEAKQFKRGSYEI